MKISVQLYTVRSLLEKDFWGTIDGLAKAGFKTVELAGLYGHSALEIREGLAKRGMKAASMHIGFDEVRDHLDAVVGDAHTLGLEYVVIPWLDPKSFKDGWKEIAATLSKFAEKFESHDLHLGYHNHAFEFEMHDGVCGFEILWENASPKLFSELDLYWVKKGGHDPVAWLKKLSKRLRFAHFKDMDEKGEFTQVGEGKLDWDSIIKEAKSAKMLYAIIENDQPKIDPLQAVIQSREFLIKKGLKD